MKSKTVYNNLHLFDSFCTFPDGSKIKLDSYTVEGYLTKIVWTNSKGRVDTVYVPHEWITIEDKSKQTTV